MPIIIHWHFTVNDVMLLSLLSKDLTLIAIYWCFWLYQENILGVTGALAIWCSCQCLCFAYIPPRVFYCVFTCPTLFYWPLPSLDSCGIATHEGISPNCSDVLQNITSSIHYAIFETTSSRRCVLRWTCKVEHAIVKRKYETNRRQRKDLKRLQKQKLAKT